MKYKGKNRLFMSIGLVILLLLSAVILIIAKPESRGVLTAFSAIIIAAALVGVYITYKKFSAVKERVSDFPDSYQAAFFDISELLSSYSMPEIDQQEILDMILETFELAHKEGIDVNDIIDPSLRNYVDGLTAETVKVHSGIYLLSYTTSLFTGYLILMKVYMIMRSGNMTLNAFETETLDIGLVLSYALISYVFFPWLFKIIQKSASKQWSGIKRLQILIPFIIPIGIMMSLILIDDERFVKFIETPLPIFSRLWVFLLAIVLFIGSLWMTKRHKKTKTQV